MSMLSFNSIVQHIAALYSIVQHGPDPLPLFTKEKNDFLKVFL
jgi:hypothetical protein